MNYYELRPICNRLNEKFKGRLFPNSLWTIKDFIIMPDENRDLRTHEAYVLAMTEGVPIEQAENAIAEHPYLDIRIRFTNEEITGYYFPKNLGLTCDELEHYKIA